MNKKQFKITDKKLINEVLNRAEYGVLALYDEKPYAVPVNFVHLGGAVYFHGSPRGKKMRMLRANNSVSFNVVADSVLIPSYFSSTENLACPASAFYKSIIIDGETEVVGSREELAKVFSAMMEKLQPEGRYKSFESCEYDDSFSEVSVVKIRVHQISAKFNFGQYLNQERFQMVIEHLEKRGEQIDLLTANTMRQYKKEVHW